MSHMAVYVRCDELYQAPLYAAHASMNDQPCAAAAIKAMNLHFRSSGKFCRTGESHVSACACCTVVQLHADKASKRRSHCSVLKRIVSSSTKESKTRLNVCSQLLSHSVPVQLLANGIVNASHLKRDSRGNILSRLANQGALIYK
jgi:hypothetical protein